MPVQWALSIVIEIFKRKGDIRNCSSHRAQKHLEHGMKVVEGCFPALISINEIKK